MRMAELNVHNRVAAPPGRVFIIVLGRKAIVSLLALLRLYGSMCIMYVCVYVCAGKDSISVRRGVIDMCSMAIYAG